MKNKYLLKILFLCLSLTIIGNAWSQEASIPDYDVLNASIMRPDNDTRMQWIEDHKNAPLAFIDETINEQLAQSQAKFVGTSLSLLSYLQYTPSQRNQGSCGNCWVWAGTGVMEIALSVQNGIKDRFSIQFLNSCKTGSYACCGGNLSMFVNFYGGEGFSIPWSNPNASYSDGSRSCASGSSSVSCGSISTSPHYPISSIQAQAITTTGVSQATAINNIKNILNQNRAVWFAYWLATDADWSDFFNFWYQPESTIWDPDIYCGKTADSGAGGHAVMIVGYNDDDPDPVNHYWIVLNSWGTAGGNRPNGLFRMKMNMNYGCQDYYPGYGWFYDREFETIGIAFSAGCTYSLLPTSASFPASGGTGSVGVTTQSGCSWTATSNALWITVTSGSSGTGNGTVSYSVASNSGSSRTGTITIAGQTFTVNQEGAVVGITVTAPNGGETWQRGTTQTIIWGYAGSVGSYVKIELLKGGALNRTITRGTSIGSGGNGSYNWNIPSTQTIGSDYKIRVTSTSNPTYKDTSDNNFTIGSGGGTTFSASGSVTLSGGGGISGVAMTFSRVSGYGALPSSVQTDINGNWRQTGFESGTTYRVTPSKSGYTFTPALLDFSSESTGLNFTGTGGGTQPDLVVSSLSAPGSGVRGAKINISVTVANQGTANAGAYRLGLYFSKDSAITTGDTFAGYCEMPALASGASQTCSGSITIPSTLTRGTYYFGAYADDTGAVSESNEGNNTKSRVIRIN